ncbi:MAG: hypothetical protein ACRERC_00815 [Candidatus Binatia bacterium]
MRRAIRVFAVLLCAAGAAHAAPFAYVPNSGDNTVSVIDTATDLVVTTIPIPGPGPEAAAVSADGMRVYVTDFGGFAGKIHVIDATTNTVITSVGVLSGLAHLAISPDGAHVYGAGGSSVKVISTATNTLVPPLISHASTANPVAVAFHPSLPLAYAVGPLFQNTMAIDTTTRTVTASASLGGDSSIAIHPDGSRGFMAATCNFCVPLQGVSQFDTATFTSLPLSHVVTVGVPHVLELHPSGSPLYVTTTGGLVEAIDTTTNTLVSSEPVGTDVWGIALHPDGSRLYVADRGAGVVRVVDATTLSVLNTIPVGTLPMSRGEFIGPLAVCGDGQLTFPEACDDGNTTSGDCCSSTCTAETGDPCSDGNACTTNDACNASAACAGGAPPDCDDDNLCTEDSCDEDDGCINDATPRSCRASGKSLLLIKDHDDDTKDSLVWKFIKGDATDAADFGDPAAGTDYALCLYSGTAASLVGRAEIAAGPSWIATASGFKYSDPVATAVRKALLKGGAQGKSKALVKGKGTGLPDVDLTALAEPVRAQLVNSDTESSGVCWETAYSAAEIANDGSKFKGKD